MKKIANMAMFEFLNMQIQFSDFEKIYSVTLSSQWLSQFNNVVIIGFKPGFRQWPSLVNHAYFHGYELQLFQNIKGICDLKDLVQMSKLCLGKCDTLDKIHKQIFHKAVETHRAKEMTESIIKILEKLGQTTKLITTGHIDDSIKS